MVIKKMKKKLMALLIISIFLGTISASAVAQKDSTRQEEETGSISFDAVFGVITGEIKVTCEMVYPIKEKVGEITYYAYEGRSFENLKVPGIYRIYASTDATWWLGIPIHGIPRLVVLTKINPNKNIIGLYLVPGLK